MNLAVIAPHVLCRTCLAPCSQITSYHGQARPGPLAQNVGASLEAQNVGAGLVAQNVGAGLVAQNVGAGLVAQNVGAGLVAQNVGAECWRRLGGAECPNPLSFPSPLPFLQITPS
jgi:hypothetical protein